jgi:hypothetical protein
LTCALHRICFQAGSQAPLQHIHAEFTDIKARNEAQQARVEDILSQRLALEQQAKQVGAALTAQTTKFLQAGKSWPSWHSCCLQPLSSTYYNRTRAGSVWE